MKRLLPASVTLFLLISIFIIQVGIASAQNIKQDQAVRGCTNTPVQSEGFISIGVAPDYQPKPTAAHIYKSHLSDRGWSFVEQVDFDLYIESGKHFAVYFDEISSALNTINPQYNNALSGDANDALDKAPQWMRKDLLWVFSNITADYQDFWASAILDANDPIIDEIAFCIAHSSPQYLMSDYGTPDLFTENAQHIYDFDTYLDYVEVVDYGTSASDENYYTTTKYFTERDAVVSQFEVPRDIYYWYIVHPKITDEIPAYIDPDHTEDNSSHNDNIIDPPTGKFWRDYLFNYADAGYPILKDSLAGCPIVWDGTQTINSDNNNAIEIINKWVKSSLIFDSDDERPHQPVRIYKKHKGRCGEHADFTAAATRAALIPATSIFAYSTDHTWNEFWDQDWVMWEPVNNFLDRPLVYENSWGWTFGTVFEIRSDGFLTSVTEKYSEGIATINIYVTDNNGDPVDGAKVRLYAKDQTYPIYWNDFYTLSDNEGKCTVLVGEGRDYAVNVKSAIGNNPEEDNKVLQITSSAVAGEAYSKSLPVTGIMPSLSRTVIDTPDTTGGHYQMVVNITTPHQVLMGDIFMDDVASDSKHCKNIENGWVDFFMTDETNYNQYAAGSAFETFNLFEDAFEVQHDFYVPSSGAWYCIFSDDRNLNNPQHITGTVELYTNIPSAVADRNPGQPPVGYTLENNFPNPFNPATTITYHLQKAGKVKMSVYDINGRLITTLVNGYQEMGKHAVKWDAKDNPSGVYFYRIYSGDFTEVRKCILVK